MELNLDHYVCVYVCACVCGLVSTESNVERESDEDSFFSDLRARLVKRVLHLWLQTPTQSALHQRRAPQIGRKERKRQISEAIYSSLWLFPPCPRAIIDPPPTHRPPPPLLPAECHSYLGQLSQCDDEWGRSTVTCKNHKNELDPQDWYNRKDGGEGVYGCVWMWQNSRCGIFFCLTQRKWVLGLTDTQQRYTVCPDAASDLRSPWPSWGLTDRVVNSINTQWWAIICLTQLEKWSSERTWQAVTGQRDLTDRQNEFAVGWGFVQSFSPFVMIPQMHFFFLREQTEGVNSWRQRSKLSSACP